MNRVCVFCGSSPGFDPAYEAAAIDMGRLLAEKRIGLVYGGGRVGLMGAVADAALEAGGEVIGVIPEALVSKEIEHRGLSELHVVPTMHVRKQMMAELSDGFVAMPGGIGTMEELFEVWTWAQLGMHRKPVGLLDVAGFYRPLLAFVDAMERQGFLKGTHSEMLLVDGDAEALLAQMSVYRPPDVWKWLDAAQS